MNKKILIPTISLFSVLALIFGIYVIYFKKNPVIGSQNGNHLPITNGYTLSITENSVNLKADLIYQSKTTKLAVGDIQKYALISFNRTRDIMLVFCPEPLLIYDPYSPTGNTVTTIPLLNEININIIPKQNNSLIFTCDK